MDAIKAEEIVKGLLKENDRRNAIIYAKFDRSPEKVLSEDVSRYTSPTIPCPTNGCL